MQQDATTGTFAPADHRPRPRRGLRLRIVLAVGIVTLILAATIGRLVAQDADDQRTTGGPGASTPSAAAASSTTTAPAATTTTIPPLAQAAAAALPPVPNGEARSGSRSPEVAAYEQRLKDLHFDPGPIDGTFDEKTRFAVEAVEKIFGWERNGTIDQPFVDALGTFQYPQSHQPNGAAERVEIDLDRQVLTVYKDWQVALITTTSTGNGKRFCGGSDGCQYAVTPTGRYEFQWHVDGWRDGDLGRLYNPWYFNGGIAVHGYESVPTQPASHGCARIPMHIAKYFGTLVRKHMAVYVFGNAASPSGGPLPPRGAPSTGSTAPVTPPPAPTPTAAPAPPVPQTTSPPPPTTPLPPPPPTTSTTTTAPATTSTTGTTVAPAP